MLPFTWAQKRQRHSIIIRCLFACACGHHIWYVMHILWVLASQGWRKKPSAKVHPGAFSSQDKDGRSAGELLVSKSIGCDTFSLQCSDIVGWWQERLLVCKTFCVGVLMVAVRLELVAPVVTTTSVILAPIKSRMLTFWYPYLQWSGNGC